MIEVNLFDREFIHTESLFGYITCSDTLKPKIMKWVNGKMEYDGITVFTDNFILDPIVDEVKSKIKIFWLLEPPVINPRTYKNIVDLENKFDYILTYDEDLLKRGEKYIKYIVGQSRVEFPKIYDKNKLVSMIASHKTISVGHNFRHEIAKKLSTKHNIDMWGSGYRRFDNKLSPLSEYYFSISVMNCRMNNFFTEVLVDNFMCGTIPIFWGCPNIGEYFDTRGMITFETIEELDTILSNLSIDDYTSRLEHVNKNLQLAHEYVSTDDYIAKVLKNKFNL